MDIPRRGTLWYSARLLIYPFEKHGYRSFICLLILQILSGYPVSRTLLDSRDIMMRKLDTIPDSRAYSLEGRQASEASKAQSHSQSPDLEAVSQPTAGMLLGGLAQTLVSLLFPRSQVSHL